MTDDTSVEATPVWKLQMVAKKLTQTNTVADKLGSASDFAPPAGFEWGKSK